MKTRKIVAFILAVLCCIMTGCDVVIEEDNYAYNTFTNTLTVNCQGEMTYEDTLEWDNIENPKHVVISDGITNIAEAAFDYWFDGNTDTGNEFNKLKTVEIPDSVIEIGPGAFYACEKLSKINIPNSVTKIGYEALLGTAIKKCVLPQKLTKISYGMFEFCDKLKKVEFGDCIEFIGNSAFYECKILSELQLPESLVTIKGSAFYKCEKLDNIIIPDKVTFIGNAAFRGCSSFTEIVIPESVKEIGIAAFACCDNMKTVTVKSKDVIFGKHSFGYTTGDFDFEKIESFTIKGYKGSTAEQYATENGFNFVALDE